MRSTKVLVFCALAVSAVVQATNDWGVTIKGGAVADCETTDKPRKPPQTTPVTKHYPPETTPYSKPTPPATKPETSPPVTSPPVSTPVSSPPASPPASPPVSSPPASPPVSSPPASPPVSSPPASPPASPPVSSPPASPPVSSPPASSPPVTSSTEVVCTSGSVLNSAGICTPSTTVICGTGSVVNSAGVCAPTSTPVCGTGMIVDSTGKCVPPTSTSVCTGGMVTDSTGKCVPPSTSTPCAAGSSMNSAGVCVPGTETKSVPVTCLSGTATKYTIVAKDTCSSIALASAETLEFFKSMNAGVNCDDLTVGSTVMVCPLGEGKTASVNTAKTSVTDCTQTACGGITYATSNTYTGVVPVQSFSGNTPISTTLQVGSTTVKGTTPESPVPTYQYESGASKSRVSVGAALVICASALLMI